VWVVALVHPESLPAAGSKGHDIIRAKFERLYSLQKNAQIVIPQAPFAGGICFFLNIYEKSRSLTAAGRPRCARDDILSTFSANCLAAKAPSSRLAGAPVILPAQSDLAKETQRSPLGAGRDCSALWVVG